MKKRNRLQHDKKAGFKSQAHKLSLLEQTVTPSLS